MNVKEIITEYLQKHGYDGLYDPGQECGCPLKDLMWCCEQGETCVDDCRPGTRQWSRDHGWIIGPKEGDNRVEGE